MRLTKTLQVFLYSKHKHFDCTSLRQPARHCVVRGKQQEYYTPDGEWRGGDCTPTLGNSTLGNSKLCKRAANDTSLRADRQKVGGREKNGSDKRETITSDREFYVEEVWMSCHLGEFPVCLVGGHRVPVTFHHQQRLLGSSVGQHLPPVALAHVPDKEQRAD